MLGYDVWLLGEQFAKDRRNQTTPVSRQAVLGKVKHTTAKARRDLGLAFCLQECDKIYFHSKPWVMWNIFLSKVHTEVLKFQKEAFSQLHLALIQSAFI